MINFESTPEKVKTLSEEILAKCIEQGFSVGDFEHLICELQTKLDACREKLRSVLIS